MGLIKKKGYLPYLFLVFDVLVIVLMARLLLGNTTKYQDPWNDAGRYRCYVAAFWHGETAATQIGKQCSWITSFGRHNPSKTQLRVTTFLKAAHFPNAVVTYFSSQSPTQAFHDLPQEYPLLVMVPLSLGQLGDASSYEQTFAYFVIALTIVIYFLLVHWRSRASALAFALYMIVGTEWLVGIRFDIYPAFCTLLAVILASYKRWNWSFAFLAVATLLKFYPVLLLIPFLLAQQRELPKKKWLMWKRWQPLIVYCVICAFVTGISFALYITGTLAPLSFFSNRPVQVESCASSVVWLLNAIRHQANELTYKDAFGSLNIFGPYTTIVSKGDTYALVGGIIFITWLQWIRKIDLAKATLFLLLVIIVTGKVFSPQYLIWVLPLVAYVGGTNRWWIGTWLAIGFLTTWIFPYIYASTSSLETVPLTPLFFPITIARNILLTAFVITCLGYYAMQKPVKLSATVYPQNRKDLLKVDPPVEVTSEMAIQ